MIDLDALKRDLEAAGFQLKTFENGQFEIIVQTRDSSRSRAIVLPLPDGSLYVSPGSRVSLTIPPALLAIIARHVTGSVVMSAEDAAVARDAVNYSASLLEVFGSEGQHDDRAARYRALAERLGRQG